MRMLKIVIISAAVAAVIWVAASRADRQPREDFGRVPDLTLKDYSGKSVSLADFRGRPLVINAWAGWCPFCREELPDFAAVQKEFGDKIVIIAVNREESLETQKQYTDQLGVSNELIFLQDPEDSFFRAIQGFVMPETIFVDGEGIIRDRKRGPMEAAEIRQRINNLLFGTNRVQAVSADRVCGADHESNNSCENEGRLEQ